MNVLARLVCLCVFLSVIPQAHSQSPTAGTALKAQDTMQCAVNLSPATEQLKKKGVKPAERKKIFSAINSLAAHSSATSETHHCCDQNGCSRPVGVLTVCPVLKICCRERGNQCICGELEC